MSNMVGGLIQMNSHMVVTDNAVFFLILGSVVTALCLFVMIANWVDGKSWKTYAITVVIAIIGAVIILVGAKMPRIKEIHACADGPIGLEQVAAVYDIVKVDGKELVLREK